MNIYVCLFFLSFFFRCVSRSKKFFIVFWNSPNYSKTPLKRDDQKNLETHPDKQEKINKNGRFCKYLKCTRKKSLYVLFKKHESKRINVRSQQVKGACRLAITESSLHL